MDWLGETDTFCGAADTGVSGADGPRLHSRIAEQDDGAIRVGFWPFAADFVEAKTPAMAFVAELKGKPARIEVGAALAVLVDQAAEREERAALIVDGWQLVKR